MNRIIIEQIENGQVVRVGLYEKDTLKWVKWLPKKKYKAFAKINNYEIVQLEG